MHKNTDKYFKLIKDHAGDPEFKLSVRYSLRQIEVQLASITQEHEELKSISQELYLMLSSADVWEKCEDCERSWNECNIHPLCKVFFNSKNLDEFIKTRRSQEKANA